jgi:hypothetical protein
VAQNEAGFAQATQAVTKLTALASDDPAASAAFACSGELFVDGRSAAFKLAGAAGKDQLERWRETLANAGNVAFSAVGSRQLLNQTQAALERAEAWATANGPADPWPDQDISSLEREANTQPEISIALRVADPTRALQAAAKLAKKNSRLKLQLASLVPSWSLSRSIATARPRGACLKLDLQMKQGAPSSVEEVARAAYLTEREARTALEQSKPSPFVLDQRILMAEDPREAASLAAWRAHISQQPTGKTRRVVYARTRPNLPKSSSVQLKKLLAQYQQGKVRDLEQTLAVEPGQGEVWMLLASRCGTLNETTREAGHSALLVDALARRARETHSGVVIEPYVSTEGVGLLAHAPRRDLDETPTQHARRVGRVLAEAMSVTAVTFEDTALSRTHVLDRIGPNSDIAWWTTIETLSPNHPSWLSPWGTYQSITDATKTNLDSRHDLMLGEPLRVAIIANRSKAQAQAGLSELQRWLAPLRSKKIQCNKHHGKAPEPGQLEVQSATPNETATAFIGVRTPIDPGALLITRYLLARSGGWLEQALALPGLVTHAQAHALGGEKAQALVVEVHSVDDKLTEAVQQVRALFDRLARGAVSASDIEVAQRQLDATDTLAQLNPRGRLVELWRAEQGAPKLTLARLRKFHSALAGQHHLVVNMKASEQK